MIDRTVLDQILDMLDVHSSEIHLLGGYFNNVYEVALEEPIVIKIFNRDMEREDQVFSEIEWTQFLQEHGLHVSVPILIKGSYLNQLTDRLFFAAYKKLPGSNIDVTDHETWNSQLFYRWGKGMGLMHSLSKMYGGQSIRPEWHEQKIYHMGLESLDPIVKNKWETYVAQLQLMNRTKDTFGIIHGDLHQHNLIYSDGELSFIDFGDSEHHWFAYDIAIAIYHAAQTVNDNERGPFSTLFYNSFMDGYVTENPVDDIIKQIDYFINFRHLYSYVYHHQFMDRTKLTSKQQEYLEKLKMSIVNHDSYLGITLVNT